MVKLMKMGRSTLEEELERLFADDEWLGHVVIVQEVMLEIVMYMCDVEGFKVDIRLSLASWSFLVLDIFICHAILHEAPLSSLEA
eukprot:4468893-Amphidinium_carterae.1